MFGKIGEAAIVPPTQLVTALDVNAFVRNILVQLNAVEAAESIERAFAGNRLDVGLMGPWEEF